MTFCCVFRCDPRGRDRSAAALVDFTRGLGFCPYRIKFDAWFNATQGSMDVATYAPEAAVESDHWWFVGRRCLFSDIIGRLGLPRAVRFCSEKGLGEVELGDVCALPFPDGRFDLVLATDVIEHVDDDCFAGSSTAQHQPMRRRSRSLLKFAGRRTPSAGTAQRPVQIHRIFTRL
jgi:hypothetical protein